MLDVEPEIAVTYTNYFQNEQDVHKTYIDMNAKLLQKSEMRKDIVIELSYKGFS